MARSTRLPFLLGLAACGLMGARGGCDFGDDPPPAAEPCSRLTERACLADETCEPVYVFDDCGCEDLRVCDCEGERLFEGCKPREPQACPAIACDVHCPHGHELDEHGCPGCSCLPPPGCTTDAECERGEICLFADDCACPACYGPGCPDCDCPTSGICVPREDRCEGAALDERGNCLGAYDQPLPADCCERACAEVNTYAADPKTGTCYAFATPCDVPEGYVDCE